jgi:hypothetical protein
MWVKTVSKNINKSKLLIIVVNVIAGLFPHGIVYEMKSKFFFVVKKHLKDLNLLPLECLYLNKNALNTVVGPQVMK